MVKSVRRSDPRESEQDVGTEPGQYQPILPSTASLLGRGVMRRVIEAAVETLVPVAGAGITELYRHSHPSLADRIRQQWERRIARSLSRMGSTLEAHEIVLRDLQSFVISKANYEHASRAGLLSFFHTGMRGHLRKIADGKGDSSTMDALSAGLQESDEEVELIIASLTAARDMMLDQPENIAFSHRLDNVLYGPVGKMGIRYDIERILQGDPTSRGTQDDAASLCNRIEQFNKNVAALAFERRP